MDNARLLRACTGSTFGTGLGGSYQGVPNAFTYWGAGEPGTQPSNEFCVEYWKIMGKWNNMACSVQGACVCVVPPA
jgi:hypothetical protein